MQRDPRYWKGYYTTEHTSRDFDLQYSLSDRIRYYWNVPEVRRASEALVRKPGRPAHTPDTAQPVTCPSNMPRSAQARSATTPASCCSTAWPKCCGTNVNACHPAAAARTSERLS